MKLKDGREQSSKDKKNEAEAKRYGSEGSKKFEINFSTSEKNLWVFSNYSHAVMLESPNMNFGDAVWINHLEIQAELRGTAFSTDQSENNLLQKAKNIEGVVNFQLSSNKSEALKSYHGLWIIERPKKLTGGWVSAGSEFHLRHYLTGLFLKAYKPDDTLRQKTTLNLVKEPDEFTIFKFEIVKRGYSKEFIEKS